VTLEGTFSFMLTLDCQVPSQQTTKRLPQAMSSLILEGKDL
jgi:hypothetical protein